MSDPHDPARLVDVRPVVAAAAGPVVLFAAILIILAGSAIGWRPMWPASGVTMSEAAALGDAAEVLVMIRRGEATQAAYDVRPGMLFDDGRRMTPIQAAVWGGREDVVALLLANGAPGSETERLALGCWARAQGRTEIETRLLPAGVNVDCSVHEAVGRPPR